MPPKPKKSTITKTTTDKSKAKADSPNARRASLARGAKQTTREPSGYFPDTFILKMFSNSARTSIKEIWCQETSQRLKEEKKRKSQQTRKSERYYYSIQKKRFPNSLLETSVVEIKGRKYVEGEIYWWTFYADGTNSWEPKSSFCDVKKGETIENEIFAKFEKRHRMLHTHYIYIIYIYIYVSFFFVNF